MAHSRKNSGNPTSGDDVYFMLPEGGPNAGKPRPAKIVRVIQNEERNEAGTLPWAVDLFVFALGQDGIRPEQLAVPKSAVGVREPGTWDWPVPEESGF